MVFAKYQVEILVGRCPSDKTTEQVSQVLDDELQKAIRQAVAKLLPASMRVVVTEQA